MNKNRCYVALMLSFACFTTAVAQDSYDAARFASSDLNGTARYVGMGGALAALGGDMSVMQTNPAGTALFRKNEAAFTLGVNMTSGGALGHDAARMSVDNAGVVFATRYGSPNDSGLRFVNFGINYVKNTNYLGNLKTGVNNLHDTFSQTFQIADLANMCYETDSWGFISDMAAPYIDKDGNLVFGGIIVKDENGLFDGIAATEANYHRATYGSNSQVDANISFNVSDRYFFGITMGAYSIDYSRESYYEELGVDGNYYDFSNWYETTGEGFDVKLGFICRPVQSSPFRFGISVHTPTWYDMEDVNGSVLYYNNEFVVEKIADPFRYSYRTPWKFGLSLGHTIGNYIALGAEYNYSDVSTAKYSSSDWNNDAYFRNVNEITKNTLKAQHTFKLGMEVKPSDELSVRVGYNFISSPFKSDAYRTIQYDSPFTETDFTNWKDTNRFTFGLGYRFNGGYVDVAYQYTAQEGDFYAFDDIDLKPTKIENNKSHLLCTLGFRF